MHRVIDSVIIYTFTQITVIWGMASIVSSKPLHTSIQSDFLAHLCHHRYLLTAQVCYILLTIGKHYLSFYFPYVSLLNLLQCLLTGFISSTFILFRNLVWLQASSSSTLSCYFTILLFSAKLPLQSLANVSPGE